MPMNATRLSALVCSRGKRSAPSKRARVERGSVMKTIVLDVPDISCEHCERTITDALTPVEGIRSVQVDIPEKQVRVDYDEDGRWLVIHRGALRIAANLADAPARIPLSPGVATPVLLVASAPEIAAGPDAIVMPAASFAVASVGNGRVCPVI